MGKALLGADDREIVLRHQFDGKSFPDMARSLGAASSGLLPFGRPAQ